MRVLELFDDGNIVELDVEVLIYALERAAEADVVFELDGDLMVDEGFEEAAGWLASITDTIFGVINGALLVRLGSRLLYLKKSMAGLVQMKLVETSGEIGGRTPQKWGTFPKVD